MSGTSIQRPPSNVRRPMGLDVRASGQVAGARNWFRHRRRRGAAFPCGARGCRVGCADQVGRSRGPSRGRRSRNTDKMVRTADPTRIPMGCSYHEKRTVCAHGSTPRTPPNELFVRTSRLWITRIPRAQEKNFYPLSPRHLAIGERRSANRPCAQAVRFSLRVEGPRGHLTRPPGALRRRRSEPPTPARLPQAWTLRERTLGVDAVKRDGPSHGDPWTRADPGAPLPAPAPRSPDHKARPLRRGTR